MFENIQCIGFDADDTLWENEAFYAEAEEGFLDVMEYAAENPDAFNCLARTEERNMACLGYGAKAMTISMIEAAIELDPHVPSEKLLKIIECGKKLLSVPTQMYSNVVPVLELLRQKYRIVIITKGELNEQQRKFDHSPIDKSIDYFVLDDKNVDSYRRLFAHEHIDVSTFLMVGNSPKSDILPILEMGGYAAFIPSDSTWNFEQGVLPEHPKLSKLQSVRGLLELLSH